MSLHKEINFENDVCAHLGANGWLYEEDVLITTPPQSQDKKTRRLRAQSSTM
jgi:type I restriction enzyme R subunit